MFARVQHVDQLAYPPDADAYTGTGTGTGTDDVGRPRGTMPWRAATGGAVGRAEHRTWPQRAASRPARETIPGGALHHPSHPNPDCTGPRHAQPGGAIPGRHASPGRTAQAQAAPHLAGWRDPRGSGHAAPRFTWREVGLRVI
ncbi:hypothetical protein Afil01_62800 [Actinorhabdospora filicis]|uniref:Uncharacterized protein n=1 Tax=Actinorhabdospora filicis TaxID=1785913 RepID=A0A9W6WCV5_9ACTN|nr:hypothetical protein Afil01_62800 [Actinorhabdospora filicis]